MMQETEAEKRERLVVEFLSHIYNAVIAIPLPAIVETGEQGREQLKECREALRRAHSILGDLRSGK